MSAYSDWKAGHLTDEEYRSSMRRECEDSLPFYTDDPDDPHWRCENCGHCMTFQARKPKVGFRVWVDDKGYVHNNKNKPIPENLYAYQSYDAEYVTANICMITHNQVMDDDYCEEFQEKIPEEEQ